MTYLHSSWNGLLLPRPVSWLPDLRSLRLPGLTSSGIKWRLLSRSQWRVPRRYCTDFPNTVAPRKLPGLPQSPKQPSYDDGAAAVSTASTSTRQEVAAFAVAAVTSGPSAVARDVSAVRNWLRYGA